MSFSHFDVYFSGKIIAGQNPDMVREKIGKIFKVQGAKLDSLFSGEPIKVKKNVDVATASKYRETFRNAGALIDIKPAATEQPIVEPQAAKKSQEPVALPAAVAATDDTIIELMPANQGSLDDCAPEITAVNLPDISGLHIYESTEPLDATPMPAPAEIDTSLLSVTAANTGTLDDCAEEIEFTALPDISSMDLSDPADILDTSTFIEAPTIDISNLSVDPANSGSLDDCAIEVEAIKIPDISQLKLVDGD